MPTSLDRPLEIAITHTRFSYSGGIEKYIYSLVERLLAAGHRVHYFAARFEEYDHTNLHFHRVPLRRFPKSGRVRNFDRSLRRELAKHRFDLVHGFTKTTQQDIYTDGSGTLLEYVAAARAELTGWRRRLYLASPHQRAILDMERRRFQRDAILRIIPMADFVKRQILARYPVDPARIETVYNGVETEVFHPSLRDTLGREMRRELGIEDRARVLAFVGNDWGRKGLEVALACTAELNREAPTVLLVAGHDNHPRRYREQAKHQGLEDNVHWLGSVRDIRRVFAAADLFLFPTRYDVFGNVGLEALASGVPAILSSASGVAELLLEPNVGHHSAAGRRLEDPSSILELMLHAQALLQPNTYPEACAAARALAEQYSWDRHFERIAQIYREVVAEKEALAKTEPTR